jgi:acetyl-CoA acetyltransferase
MAQSKDTAEIEIVGVGMHPFGRFEELALKDLARVAVLHALIDAGLGVKDIEAAYAANAMAGLLLGQEMIRGQATLRDVGLERVPIVNVENACASGSSALRQAILTIRAGAADVVLAVGFEKMFTDSRDRALDALESAADLDVVRGAGLQFTAVYAMRLRKLLETGALTAEDLAAVSVKSRANGAMNPYAQHRTPVSVAGVLASRVIADPLTLPMCSSMSDGAAAVIVARKGLVDADGRPRVLVRASQAMSGFVVGDDPEPSLSERCSALAYAEAGVGPDDVDIAEVHDAMAPAELMYYEQLGFCASGAAAEYFASGATQVSGKRPVNTSGGLCARGHPVGATGLAQVAELVWQLRGEAGQRQAQTPRVGLAQNSGGWLEGESAAANVHLLERITPWT